MFLSKRKIHSGIFIKIINEIKPTLLFWWPASNFLKHFFNCLSPFLTSYVPPLEIYFCEFIWTCFSLFCMKLFTRNLCIHFKKCQNVQTMNKLKATSKPGPGPWKTWTLKDLDHEKPKLWKTWSLKKRAKRLHVEKWLEDHII